MRSVVTGFWLRPIWNQVCLESILEPIITNQVPISCFATVKQNQLDRILIIYSILTRVKSLMQDSCPHFDHESLQGA